MRDIETRYINQIDLPSDGEMERIHLMAEELIINAINNRLAEFRARPATMSEDSGVRDIGPKQIIDAVIYHKDKPVLGVQVTTSQDIKAQQKKMREMIDRPFVRLEEMKPSDPGIPRILIHMDREMVRAYDQNKDTQNRPEVMLKILDGSLKSLTFIRTKTQNPPQIKAIEELIERLTEEQRKLVH